MKLLYGLIFSLGLLLSHQGQAWELRHTIEPSDSMMSLQTQGLCHSILEYRARTYCLPWSHSIIDSGKISILALAKTNEKGLSIYERARDKDLNQDFLDKLFRDDNFQDISGFIEARALYRNMVFSIIPLHFAAGFKLNNPSLPEIHFIEERQTLITTGATWLFEIPQQSSLGLFVVAPLLSYFERSSSAGDYDVLDSVTTPYKQLVKTQNKVGTNLDLALGWSSPNPLLPSVTAKAYRIFAEKSCELCDTYLTFNQLIQRKSQTSVTWTIDHPIGTSIFGFSIPFFDLWGSIDQDQTAIAYSYKISRLQAYSSFSSAKTSFGFTFDANLYQVGIQYSSEYQDQGLQQKKVNQSYAYTALVL